MVVYSNESASRDPPAANGTNQDLKAKIRPTHGTCYGAGLASAWEVALGGADDAGEQFVLLFLSDGRVRCTITCHTL